jgi:ABC-type transport system involved in multi-copper enzyme maturation permease subunit
VSAFLLLWREALLDALRRRLVLAIAVASLLSLLVLGNCAGCAPVVEVNGQAQSLANVAPLLGSVLLIVVGLWVATLAGLLAADHLAQSLEDGHAAASLARPVGRSAFAFARLAGSLSVSLLAGAVLLGATAFWVVTRNALPAGPALLACVSCALACVTVAAFAMTASLALPRFAIWLIVLGVVFFTTLATIVAALPTPPAAEPASPSLLAQLDAWGPPLAGGMLRALSAWIPSLTLPRDFGASLVRSLVWAALGLVSLAAAFRRIELK